MTWTAPFDRDLQLAVIDDTGTHALAFPCRRVPYGWIKSGTKQGMDLGLGRLAVVGGSRTMKRAWQRPWYRVPWVLELTISGEAHEKLRESDFGPVLRPGEPGRALPHRGHATYPHDH
jgi:hypothetical protein